ncbi:MAG: hypothetical protein MJ113_01930 [Lachnospiraceae bacterium]|nr:hypothetical protein [Lachnospiraceae bacterium]
MNKKRILVCSMATSLVLLLSGCDTVELNKLSENEQVKVETMISDLLTNSLESKGGRKETAWPDNEFTKLVSKPKDGTLISVNYVEGESLDYLVEDITKKEAANYAKKLGTDKFTENQKSSGIDDDLSILYFIAKDKKGNVLYLVYTSDNLHVKIISKAVADAENASEKAKLTQTPGLIFDLKNELTTTPKPTPEVAKDSTKEIEITKMAALLPTPEVGKLFSETFDEKGYVKVYNNTTVSACRSLTEKMKEAGYTKDTTLLDQKVLGLEYYSFSAKDSEGKYIVTFTYSVGIMTMTFDEVK